MFFKICNAICLNEQVNIFANKLYFSIKAKNERNTQK